MPLYQILPFIIPITYFFVLPRPDKFSAGATYDDDTEGALSAHYTRLPNEVVDEEDAVPVTESEAHVTAPIALSMEDKWRLAKPMLTKYMLPLCESFVLQPSI